MNRLLKLEYLMLDFINRQEGKVDYRDETLNWERVHMASSARLAYEMAIDRDTDPELAACAAAVHDFGRIITGRQSNHAEEGYLPVQDFLRKSQMFTEEEIEVISMAVKNHSSKTVKGTVIEEIVKDADVVDCYQFGYPFDRPEKEERYKKWLEFKKTY